jgi:superfamily II DNA or RNA helicase
MKKSLIVKLQKGECKDLVTNANVIIYDEAHTFGNSKGDVLILKHTTGAMYKVGFTATPSRSDSELFMEQHISKVGVELQPEEVAIVKPKVLMIYTPPLNIINYIPSPSFLSFEYRPLYVNDKPQRLDVYQVGIVDNQIRNHMICDLIEAYHYNSSARPQLIVLEAIQHGETLQKILKRRGLIIPFVSGRDTNREEYLDNLRTGKIKSLISSNIFKTAVNIPNLGAVINAGGGASKHLSQQLVGRVTRIDGNKVGIVIDFFDDSDYYLRSNSRQRKQAIEEGFNLKMEEVELWQATEWLRYYEK